MNNKDMEKILKIAKFWKRRNAKNNTLFHDPNSRDLVREDLHLLSKALIELYDEREAALDVVNKMSTDLMIMSRDLH